MKTKALLAIVLLALAVSISAQRMTSFETGWKFHRNGVINAEMPACDDATWRTVTLPHDFSLEPAITVRDSRASLKEWDDVQVGPFTRLNIGNSDQGQTQGGEGWYRKTFRLSLAAGQSMDDYLSKNEVSIQFDGVYNTAEVWVNGQKAAMNMYGYMPFVVNLNDVLRNKAYRLKDEREVCIAVRSLNVDHNSRWYSGSGIFRRVWLVTTGKQHLNQWDVFVDGSEVLLSGKGKVKSEKLKSGANVKITAKVYNDDQKAATGEVVFDIVDATGNVVASTTKNYQAPAATGGKRDKKGVELSSEMLVKSPHLWSDVSPYRYTARISVISSGKQCDQLEIPFGIRTIAFSVKEGFKLNGRPLKLKGGCVHHDNGLLGASAIEQAEIRKAELLKAQGYNAVRCSHNLPSEAFLNACDSIGLLVMDEVFDQWERTKTPNDYATLFSKEKLQIEDGKISPQGITNFEYDAALMVRRDRNHPSVIIWSIGNEIYQRDDPRGQEIAKIICKVIKSLDPTRPTTLANCDYWDQRGKTWEKDSYRAFENVDLGGYNYGTQFYEKDHEKYPERIIVGTENYPSAIGATWKFVEEHPYVIGDFVWTAIDYVGEAGVGHTFERTNDAWVQLMSWPWFNAWCGDIDLTGCKKPQSYYRDVVWRRSNIEMAVRPAIPQGEHEEVRGWGWTAEERHWNWGNYLPFELRAENYQSETMRRMVRHDVNAQRSDSLRVNVYSREKRVRLLINDKVIGEKDVNPDNFTATFWVAYEPGELKAEVVGKVKNGMPTSISFHTAKAPAAIQMQPLRPCITASHHDLAYIYIDVVDEDGNLCPTAELPLKVETSGAKHIATCGTGHPSDMKSFRTLTPKSFRGKAVLIVQPQDEAGEVAINVTSPNLKSAAYKLRITK